MSKTDSNLNASVDKAIDDIRQYVLSTMEIPQSIKEAITASNSAGGNNSQNPQSNTGSK